MGPSARATHDLSEVQTAGRQDGPPDVQTAAGPPDGPGAEAPSVGAPPVSAPHAVRRTWQWAFALFKAADGATVALIPLAVLFVYDQGIVTVATTAAVMNLAGVPAGMLWAKVVERGRRRRRAIFLGFGTAALALFVLSLHPPFPIFLLGAALFVVAGLATAPAAGVLVLEGLPRRRWGKATGELSRYTGIAYVVGFALTAIGAFVGWEITRWMFVLAGMAAVAAAGVAYGTIPPFDPALMPPRRYQEDAARRGQRRFERPVWLPARMFNRPTWSGTRRLAGTPLFSLLLGTFLSFTGALVLFASYPGVLGARLQLTAGLILLAQAPSVLVSPLAYPIAGSIGDRFGLRGGAAIGAVMRAVVLPVLCVTLLFWGAAGYGAILGLHALMGIGFAFVSVNGACLAAELREHNRGEAVGAFHAAHGLGVLAGSAMCAALLAITGLAVSYVVASLLVLAGTVVQVGRLGVRSPPEEATEGLPSTVSA